MLGSMRRGLITLLLYAQSTPHASIRRTPQSKTFEFKLVMRFDTIKRLLALAGA